MTVFRVNKNKNFTVMSNYHLNDKRLSLRAKGLLSLMLSLPEEWDYSINGLVAISKESKKVIEPTLSELKEYKYLVVNKLMPNQTKSGRFEYEYNVYEIPIDVADSEKQGAPKQGVVLQGVEKQCIEKVPQLNTNNKQSTNKQNTNNKQSIKDVVFGYTSNEDLREALLAFIDMRKKINKPMTVRALELNLKTLGNLTEDASRQIDIVNQSIEHGWQTFYDLKDNFKKDSVVIEMPGYMEKQEEGRIISTPLNEDVLAKALKMQKQFSSKL